MNLVAKLVFGLICLIGILVSLGHLFGIQPADPSSPPGVEWWGQGHISLYQKFPYLSHFHVVPGVVFLILAPFQFSTAFRAKYLGLHRMIGRVFVVNALVLSATGLLLAWVMPFGGRPESILNTVAFMGIILCIGLALFYVRKRNIAAHREWMIRVFALATGIVTMRLVLSLTFPYFDSARTAFWIAQLWGFLINIAAGELWIRWKRA